MATVATLVTAWCQHSLAVERSASLADPTARRAIELVRQGRSQEALGVFDPTTIPPNAGEILRRTQAMLPAEEAAVELVDRSFVKPLGKNRVDESLVYHVKGRAHAALAFLNARTEDGATRLTGFRVRPAPLDLLDANTFRFGGKSALQYCVLAVAVAVPSFMLGTALACIRSARRMKWLWLPLILIGVGRIGVPWIDGGRLFARPLGVQFLGAGFIKYPVYEPWVIFVSIPLAAIWYWASGRSKRATFEAG